jgi:hypothetical protein
MKHLIKHCPRCNVNKKACDFYKASNRKDGLYAVCKVCTRIYQRSAKIRKYQLEYQRSSKAKEYKKLYYQTPKAKFSLYKRTAKKRKHPFKLTFLEFMNFWQKPCYYCGSSITTVGLDQIIPGKGYLLNNIRSCCWTCNTMKFDLTEHDFYEHIRKLADYMNKHN